MPATLREQLIHHQSALRQCTLCPDMIRPVITGQAVSSPILLIGQAPGIHEAKVQRPFGWTAGKTLFSWFASIGMDEAQCRERVYMAAVCRCFPGKKVNKTGKVGGDRVPSAEEVARCRPWLDAELQLLQPELILLVGKLAISQFMPVTPLSKVVGQTHTRTIHGRALDMIPLPHPSGLSTWFRTEPGKTLLQQALTTLAAHPAWQTALNLRTMPPL